MRISIFSRRHFVAIASCCLFTSAAVSTHADDAPGASVTVYNQRFAVVRQTIPLQLVAGQNHVT